MADPTVKTIFFVFVVTTEKEKNYYMLLIRTGKLIKLTYPIKYPVIKMVNNNSHFFF